MRFDGINDILDLDGLLVIGVSVADEAVELVVESRLEAGRCPQCGFASAQPKDRPEVLVRDLSISGRATVLRWIKRRWRCLECGSSWTECHPQVPPRARMTSRYRAYLVERARAEGNFTQVAAEEGVSYDTVARAFYGRVRQLRGQLPPATATKLCIDEAAQRRGHDYNTVISDGGMGDVIDMVQGRREIDLATWIDAQPEEFKQGVKAVAMDLWRPYHLAVRKRLPHAVRVADKFHVLRQANRALDAVRSRLSGRGYKGPSGFPRRLFEARHALMKAPHRLTDKDEAKLEAVFSQFPELKKAWELKEDLRELYLICDAETASDALSYWYRRIKTAGIPEFRRLVPKFRRWEPEILTYFGHHITNGPAEGLTNKIKVIKRQAYGMRNFDNFSDRVLVQCGALKRGRIPA